MNEILSSQTFLLTLTLAVYLGSMWLYKKVRFALLHPLIVSMGVLILFLKLSGIPYDLFMKQIQIIDFMLGLSVVALGYLLHEQISQIKGNVIAIVTAIVTGSAVGILSVALIARAMGAEQAVIASLEPKSVTTAIALNVSAQSGGIPALTAVVVILVGIFGGVAGPFILKKIGVESKIAKGLAMGAAAHAMGTARAMQLGAVEGAISGLAPGALDALLMRFCELLMSLPSLILVLFLQAVWGKPTPTSIAVVLALTSWMTLAKLVRSEVRRIRESDYILSAKIMGADFTYLLQKYLLPNLISPAMFMVVSSFGQAIIAETTLSFLGLGLPVSQVSWGSLLSLSKNALLSNQWWMILLPGLVLVTTLVCITELGEYARARNNRLQSNL